VSHTRVFALIKNYNGGENDKSRLSPPRLEELIPLVFSRAMIRNVDGLLGTGKGGGEEEGKPRPDHPWERKK